MKTCIIYYKYVKKERKSVNLYSTTIQDFKSAAVTAKGLKELDKVQKRSEDSKWKHNKLYSLFRFDDLWLTAYGKLSKNQGLTATRVDNITIDKTTRKKLKQVQKEVLNGTFEWTQIKRVFLLKSKKKKKFLQISNFKDQIVQEVIKMILNEIYKPNFSLISMERFRSNKSQYVPLREVQKTFKGIIWTIEGDISKLFYTVNYKILIELLRKKVTDNRFLKLIEKGLKSKIILPDKLQVNNELGVPLSCVYSPLLINIYIYEFDTWFAKYKELFDKGHQPTYSKEYNKLHTKSHICSQIQGLDYSQIDPLDFNFRRLEYIRYENNFLVGLICTKTEVKKVQMEIKNFLYHTFKLQLNEKKTFIIHWKNNVSFLGYGLKWSYIQVKAHNKKILTKKRILKLIFDQKIIIKKLNLAGFCTPGGKPTSNFRYIHQTQKLSNQKIKVLLERLNSYYKLAYDREKAVIYIGYILRMSLARMYATKFQLRTIKQVFKKAGKYLAKPCAAKKYNAIQLNSPALPYTKLKIVSTSCKTNIYDSIKG